MQISDLKKAATALRMLSCAAIEKANSGHPGMVLGFADVFTMLVAKFLRFNPNDAKWPARDRLVLSAGHGSMLLYSFYYLAGYADFSLDDIKNFRTLGSKTPGHPEHGAFSAIETTTGPLGQGLANSVGMSIAAKKYASKLGTEIADYKIYCIVGDGCLMEGISYEAASLAGHLKLDNLIVLFDDNKITIDGSTNLTISENQQQKFQSLGWQTLQVDGHNFFDIQRALEQAQNSDKPVFISCATTIGYGSSKAGSASCHGAALGADCFAALKEFFDWHYPDFFTPKDTLALWQEFGARNKKKFTQWQQDFAQLTIKQQEYLAPFSWTDQTSSLISNLQGDPDESSRVSASKIIQRLIQAHPKIICGSADLSSSVGLDPKSYKAIHADDFSGNFIHYGTREHAMGAIMNGLSLSGFMPIGGTFLVFSDYMRPSIRLACLMNLAIVFIMTHDSIGLGEDGPTHQPVEHLNSLRAIPNLDLWRPADMNETIGAFEHISKAATKPALIALSRQSLEQTGLSNSAMTSKGGYFLAQNDQAQISIFASGSEVAIARDTAEILQQQGIATQLISLPCMSLFFAQEQKYVDKILKNNTLKIVIEAGSSPLWHKIIGQNAMFFGIEEFGASGDRKSLYKHFGLTATNIADKIIQRYEDRN